MAIEEPEFVVESKTADYEVRRYGPVLVAETQVTADFEEAGSQAFRRLAGYIFGANHTKTKIEMTAPVNQSVQSEKIAMTAPVTQLKGASSGYWVQFTMPKKFTLESLPIPNDPLVHLREVQARRLAVFTYSGSWSESRYQEKLALFQKALQTDNRKTVGEPILARYDSPFQLWFLRRNEIWLELQ